MRCGFAALVVLMTLLLLGTGVPPPATAVEPFDLRDQITDEVGALEGHTVDVRAAIDSLEAEYDVRMWVVFVDSFDGLDAQAWANEAFVASALGAGDYVLAVAMADRQYGYVVDDMFALSDADLAVVASAAERHLAENPARAVTEAASTLGRQLSQAGSRTSDGTDDAASGWAMLAIALAFIVGVLGVGGLVVFLALNGSAQRPGPGYGPHDTTSSGSSWWTDTSHHGNDGFGGWSSGGGGGGGGTRGGSGGF